MITQILFLLVMSFAAVGIYTFVLPMVGLVAAWFIGAGLALSIVYLAARRL